MNPLHEDLERDPQKVFHETPWGVIVIPFAVAYLLVIGLLLLFIAKGSMQ